MLDKKYQQPIIIHIIHTRLNKKSALIALYIGDMQHAAL